MRMRGMFANGKFDIKNYAMLSLCFVISVFFGELMGFLPSGSIVQSIFISIFVYASLKLIDKNTR